MRNETHNQAATPLKAAAVFRGAPLLAALAAATVVAVGGGFGPRAVAQAPASPNAPAAGTKVKAATASAPNGVPSEAVSTSKIKDLTCTLAVDSDETNYEELGKIGGAFATTYRLKHMDVTYQQPNKVRFESKVLGSSLVMIYSGDKKYFHTPIKSGVQDIAGQPGQKQSLMDLGIFASDFLATDYRALFQRKENGLLVYDLIQRGSTNKSHELVWVNPKTAIIERRLSYNGDGVLKKELRFTQVTQVKPGIWVPGRIEIFNQFGKLGAVQNVEDVHVNAGVDQTKFDIS